MLCFCIYGCTVLLTAPQIHAITIYCTETIISHYEAFLHDSSSSSLSSNGILSLKLCTSFGYFGGIFSLSQFHLYDLKKKSLNTIPIHSENRKQVKTDSYGPNGSLCVFTSHIEIWWETISGETACKHHAMYLIWWSDALIKMKVMKSVKWCTNNLQVQYVGGQSF